MAKKSKLSRRLLKLKKFFLGNYRFTRIVVFSFLLILIFSSLFLSVSYLGRLGFGYYLDLAKAFIFPSSSDFISSDGRVNLLVMGKGGAGHEAPDLTDTIIFASLFLGSSEKKPSLTLVSLPRDIWISDLRTKINSLYYWGNRKEEKGGISLARVKVEEIIGVPVHYVIVVDFDVFKQIVDLIGGIDVYVESPFTDNWYPIKGKENDLCNGDPLFRCRYETVVFEKGWQRMDGEKALKFVRSRKAEGDEGTDFARSRRQQQILEAIKNGVLDKKFLLNLDRLRLFLELVSKNMETDIDIKAVFALSRKAFLAKDNIIKESLDERFLLNPPISSKYDNLYVFTPKSGSWEEIHKWVKEVLDY